MKKRILNALLVTIICIGILSNVEVSATDQNMSNPRITDYTDNQFYIEKLGVLFDKLVNNQYNYFTTTGKTCGNSKCSLCDTGNVTRQHPTISSLNVDYPVDKTNSCYGFAKWTFKYLYGEDATGVLDNPSSRKNTNTTIVVASTYDGNSSPKTVIQQAKIGDILHSPKPHSMIFLKCDEYYFYVLHSNWKWSNEGNNIVKVSKFSYDQFDKITVYRANNYSDYEHICKQYETYKNGSTKVLGACKECHKKFDYSKIYTGDVAGLWIAKKNQNISLYSEPYEDATYTSVKSGELEVTGYVKNAYGNKWYIISGDKNKTYYVYEKTFKNLYTQNSHYYEKDYHRYDSGAIIETPNSNNNAGNNNAGLGDTIVGIVDIPSSWDNLSIRSGPSTNYQIVGSMNDGVQCTVYPDKTSNGWYYVNYNGIWGYASGKQINISNSSASTQAQSSTSTSTSISTPKEKQTIKVSFDSMGGSTDYASQTVEKYGTATIPSKKPSKNGYEFLGWSTDRNDSIALYKSGETINVGNINLTFYAVWREEEASWDEWDLSLSENKLYFDASDSKQIIIIKLLEHNAKREGVDYDLKLDRDDHLDYEWGDTWYDANGYRCRELIIYNPKKQLDKKQVTVCLRDEHGYIASTKSFSVLYEEKQIVQFADRNQTGISVYLNGKKLSFDVQPQIINGRTMVPMRKIFEELGTVVGWNNNSQTAIAVKKGDVVRISIGGQYMSCNGEQKLLDSPAVIISGRTLVPVRAIAESLNCDVEWYDYGVNQVVDITMKDTINIMENKDGLRIGWCEFAPFSYYDEYGNLTGFDAELAKYVCQFWGWEPVFVEIPFDMKFVSINTGEIDCYWNGVTMTEEREEMCIFTNDYISFELEYEENGEWYTSHEVYSVPFKKGDYDTVQLVNIALEEARNDGTIEYLKYKYGIK